jgi:hypothetical protein
MSNNKLRKDLDNLRIQIGALDAYPEAKSRMSELLTDFEEHLASVEGASQSRNPTDADTSSLKHRLDDSMDRFKVEHPILTGILNNIMDTLSGMGI